MITSRRKLKKQLRWILPPVLATCALVYLALVPRPLAVETAIVKRGQFEDRIRIDGVVRSKLRYTVPAFADGDIKRVSLQVGDPVKKGDEITELFWDMDFMPVKAPITGVISKVYRESAGPIKRGEPIVEIFDPDRLEVVVTPLTTDAARIPIGASVDVESSAGQTFSAEVTRVSKAGFVKQSALGVEEERTEVVMEPKSDSPKVLESLGNNFHVDVNIQVSVRTNALIIPIGSLIRDASEWAVMSLRDGKARKQSIGLAARGTEAAMVESGLSEGEVVIVYPGDLVKEGTRVKPRA